MKVRVLIPTGVGLNCEEETAEAFRRFGARPELVPVTDLLAGLAPRPWTDYGLLAFVGGFSYGDHVAGAHVLATRLRAQLRGELEAFLAAGGLAIGICNGFQLLARLGLLPGPEAGPPDFEPRAVLAPNARPGYRDSWVRLAVDPATRCAWTRGVEAMDVPVRHGEGRFLVESDAALDALEASGRVALRYVDAEDRPTEAWPANPNGSPRGVAGVCDSTGRVLGLMPHPEAFLLPAQHPDGRRQRADAPDVPAGLGLFRAGVEAAQSR